MARHPNRLTWKKRLGQMLVLISINNICFAMQDPKDLAPTPGQPLCRKAFKKEFPAKVWRDLLARRLLLTTENRETASLCGNVCVVNIVQAIAAYAGYRPLPEPENALALVFETFGAELHLSQAALAIKMLLKTHYPHLQYTIQPYLMEGPTNTPELNTIRVNRIRHEDLLPSDERLVLAFTAYFTNADVFVFQHAQIIGYEVEKRMVIIEPSNAYNPLVAEVLRLEKLGNTFIPYYEYLNKNLLANRFAPFGYLIIDVVHGDEVR